MKVHSNKLRAGDMYSALHEAGLKHIYAEVVEQGSRSRARGFTFRLEAYRSSGRPRNSGTHGAESGVMAATWDEHGAYFAVLFDRDPGAIIGRYDGRNNFHKQTEGKYRRETVAS